eukprot:Clim_evm46s231 gene=Clim_evmTU46s231
MATTTLNRIMAAQGPGASAATSSRSKKDEKPHTVKIPKRVGLYIIGDMIGRGGFCVVREATHVLTKDKVAVKIVNKRALDQRSMKALFHEVHILQRLSAPAASHPHIGKLYEIVDTEDVLYMFLELCSGGNIREYIKSIDDRKKKLEEVRRLTRQIILALEHIHSYNIAHRDMKALNILLDHKMNAKLVDYGLSVQCWPGQFVKTEWPGSPPYAAPELFRREAYLPMAVDIWSLGVVVYELICGQKPFLATSHRELMEKVLKGAYTFPAWVPPPFRRIVKLMLVPEPTKRAPPKILKNDILIRSAGMHQKNVYPSHSEVLSQMEELGISRQDISEALQKHSFGRIAGVYNIIANRYVVQDVDVANLDRNKNLRWQQKVMLQKEESEVH